MLISFKINGVEYSNWDITDAKNREQLESSGINVLEVTKEFAVAEVNKKIGEKVKNTIGDNIINLIASNSKAIALLAKLITTLNPDTAGLTELEKSAYIKIVASANSGYSDSQLLNDSLDAVAINLQAGGKAIADIQNATTIDEVIAVLNSL